MISRGMPSQPRPTHRQQVVDCAADMFEFLPKLTHHVDCQEGQQNSRLYHSLALRRAM
jgi:hypothetical protein